MKIIRAPFFLSLLALGFLLFAAAPTDAVTAPIPLNGYAWSDNIGWVSFNCSNNNSCADNGGVDYKVEIDSGYFEGFAWSDNIGWISFEANDVSGCPSGSCRAILSGASINGWARVISCKNNPDPGACGGWDGWISLSGSAPDYGVSVNSDGKFEGYAWSDLAVGWINFKTSADFPKSGGSGGVYIRPTDPSALFVELHADKSISSINITEGGQATLTWDIANVALGSCTKTSEPEDLDWNNCRLEEGFCVVKPIQNTTYTLDCQGVSDSVVINIISEEEPLLEPPPVPPIDEIFSSVESFSIYADSSISITILDEEGETCAFDSGNTSTITVVPINEFSEDVSLSISKENWGGLDTYLFTGSKYTNGYGFSINPLTSSNYNNDIGSIFDICVKPSTPKGRYTVKVEGSSQTKGVRYTDVIVNILTSDPTWKEI